MARRNIGRYVRFPQFCKWGMSMHYGEIVGVEKDSYIVKEGIFLRSVWIYAVEFVDSLEK